MKATIKWLHKNIYLFNTVLVILMFALPFLENKIPNKYSRIPIIWIGVAIVVLLEIIVTYEEYVKRKKKDAAYEGYWKKKWKSKNDFVASKFVAWWENREYKRKYIFEKKWNLGK